MRRYRRWQVYRFWPQNWVQAGLPVWASKPGGCRFAGLDLKTEGTSDAARWWLRRSRGIIAKLVSRQSEVVKVACLSGAPRKIWMALLPRGIWVVCFI